MSDPGRDIDPHLFQLVLSLQAGAMQQMGKFASPISGRIERDLQAAQAAIDTLSMLLSKMAGNLTPDEKSIVEHVLYELRINYVDEVKKGDKDPQEDTTSEAQPSEPEEKGPDTAGTEDATGADEPSEERKKE